MATWSEPKEIFEQRTFRHTGSPDRDQRAEMITTETLAQFIDWNGDGRLDILDARGRDGNHWKLWVNMSGPNGMPIWGAADIPISDLRAHIDRFDLGLGIYGSGHVALERTRTWQHLWSRTCEDLSNGYGSPCPLAFEEMGKIDTVAEWLLTDVNADGYVDTIANTNVVRECDLTTENHQYGSDFNWRTFEHQEFVTVQRCDAEDAEIPDNSYVAILNRGGALLNTVGRNYELPLRGWAGHGVAHWTTGEAPLNPAPGGVEPPLDGGVSWRVAGFSSQNGQLPVLGNWESSDGVDRFESDRGDVCGPGGGGNGTYTSRQVRGLADLNGDGIPDRVHRESTGWQVEFGRTAGYGPTRRIAQDLSFPFALSESSGACEGDAQTTAGLVDLDGDGKPELVRSVEGALRAASILGTGQASSALGAGRLIAIGNGYGARTEIRYANNKTETLTPHQLVAPEIVVAETQVLIDDESAVDSVITRFAYGQADSRYDPTLSRMVFTGYRRQVVMVGGLGDRTGPTEVFGHATVTERMPPAAFQAEHGELVLGGRVAETRRYEGNLPMDPRVLLDPTANVGQVRAKATRTYGVVALPTAAPSPFGLLDCIDVEVEHSAPAGGAALCAQAAIVYPKTSFSWEGTQSPEQGESNVAALTDVTQVDSFARPIEMVAYGDIRTVADDRCISVQYAVPTDPTSPQLSTPSGVWTTDCGWINARFYPGGGYSAGEPVLLAGRRFIYDDLPEGEVGRGRLTSSILERYDTSTGEPLGDVVEETRVHDELGNIRQVQSVRTIGTAASRTTVLVYDPFGLTAMTMTEAASDAGGILFVRAQAASVWPSTVLEQTGINGERTIVERDAFGRPKQTRVVRGSIDHTVSSIVYVDDVGGRQIEETRNTASDVIERSHVHLDALGRPRFTQVELGEDYGNTTLVEGLVEYDEYGRVVYRADSFEWPVLPFMPADLPSEQAQWPRGLSMAFDAAGHVIRLVEADGKRPDETQTSLANAVFVAKTTYAWVAGHSVVLSQGAAHNDPASPMYGGSLVSRRNAVGWAVEDARHNSAGTRLDLVHRGYDRFGAETSVTRYRVPGAGTEGLTWVRHFDSTGLLLTLAEPGNATVRNIYDEWGGLTRTEWTEGELLHIGRNTLDGFGRLVRKQSLTAPLGGGPESAESDEKYHYDSHSGSSLQPVGPVLGLLSRVEKPGVGDTYYAYDDLMRPASETHMLTDYGQPVRVRRVFDPSGAERELLYETPAGTDRFEYGRDSAGRVRTVVNLTTGATIFSATNVDAKGRYRSVTYGNGVTQSIAFGAGGREDLNEWSVSTRSGVWTDTFLSRDAEGRILTERSSQPEGIFNKTHAYDQLGRLAVSRSFGPNVNRDDNITYDPLGNVAWRYGQYAGGLNRFFKYDATDRDRLCRVERSGETGAVCHLLYDSSGNVIFDNWSGAIRTFQYDSASRIVGARKGAWSASFLYGPGGGLARTEVFSGATLDRRVWNFGGMIEDRRRPGGGRHIERRIPGPLGVIATLRTEGSTQETIYVHGDGRGNQVFTGQDGSIVQGVGYRAYGAITTNTGTPSSIKYSDDLWNGGDDLKELGIVVLGARIYDPVLGRFLQRDPISSSGSSSEGNAYSFAFNDPVNYADPSGLFASLDGSCYGLECVGGGSEGLASAMADWSAKFDRLPEGQWLATGKGPSSWSWPDQVFGTISVGKYTHSDNGMGSVFGGIGRATRDFFLGIGRRIKRDFDCQMGDMATLERCASENLETAQQFVSEGHNLANDVVKGEFDLIWDRVCAQGNGDCLEGLAYIGTSQVIALATAAAVPRGSPVRDMRGPGSYIPDRILPTEGKLNTPVPDSLYPHTQLGLSRKTFGMDPQALEWGYGSNGALQPRRAIDFTDHGYPTGHQSPHQHVIIPNNFLLAPKGGFKRLKPLPLFYAVEQ